MTVEQLCAVFDSFNVCYDIKDVNISYLSNSRYCYSDGEIKYNIDEEGYIIITVTNANYAMYLNSSNKCHLSIYNNCPEEKYKNILKEIEIMRNKLSKFIKKDNYNTPVKHHPLINTITINTYDSQDTPTDQNVHSVIDDTIVSDNTSVIIREPDYVVDDMDFNINDAINNYDIIDVNNFKCEYCGKDIEFNPNGSKLEGRCCNKQYTLSPSKYYVLDHITIYSKQTGYKNKYID